MKISKILEIPSIRILLYLSENDEVRHSDLSEIISSRGTLSYSLRELDEEELVQRRVVPTKPVQSYYFCTCLAQIKISEIYLYSI